MGFDLTSLDRAIQQQEEGLPVEIKHPGTDEPLGITIWVASYESERVLSRARAIGNRIRAERAKKPHKVPKLEQEAENWRHIAVAAIVKWEGIEYEGKPLPLTEENALMVLEKYPFIQDQIEAFGSDRANFFRS